MTYLIDNSGRCSIHYSCHNCPLFDIRKLCRPEIAVEMAISMKKRLEIEIAVKMAISMKKRLEIEIAVEEELCSIP